MQFADTIFALSTGKLPSGVAVIRMSGPHVEQVLREVVGEVPAARSASYKVIHALDGSVLDRGLAFYFPAPGSFTGESCGELHVHGSRAVVAALFERLGAIEGMRPAEPGEFTRRAFLNGKVDLTGAEALSDLVNAETESQRRLAVEGAGGLQRDLYLAWRDRLVGLRAEIEAQLDFADQDDVPPEIGRERGAELGVLRDEIAAHAARFHRSELIREGLRVVILGAPNAGKSSLLNALARRDVAIVTDEPGTTRDVLEVAFDLDGNKVVLVDTAGLRQPDGHVEAIGIERAIEAARGADLVMHVVDLASPVPIEVPAGVAALRVGLKADLAPASGVTQPELAVSARTGAGLGRLLERLAEIARQEMTPGEDALPIRERHVMALRRAITNLERAAKATELELCAEELRLASGELAAIVGIVGAEDLLDEIFSRFCIGK